MSMDEDFVIIKNFEEVKVEDNSVINIFET